MLNNKNLNQYADEELMCLIERGQERAFEELYRRYSKRLMAYFFRMLNYNKTSAEDALQELFFKIAADPGKFDNSRSFKTWVFSVASNCCKNHYRHKQVVEASLTYLVNENPESDHEFSRTAARIDARTFRLSLDEALAELPPEKKEAFILKYQEDKTIADIAFIQNCPEGSVKSRLFYAVKFLEEKLKMFNTIS